MTCPRKMNFPICWGVLLVFLQGFLCWWPFAVSIWWLVVFLETSHWPASSEISTVSTFACNTFLDGSERQDMSGHCWIILSKLVLACAMAIAVVCIVVIELCWSVGLNTLVSTMKSWLQDQGFSNADSSSVHQSLGHAVVWPSSWCVLFVGCWWMF